MVLKIEQRTKWILNLDKEISNLQNYWHEISCNAWYKGLRRMLRALRNKVSLQILQDPRSCLTESPLQLTPQVRVRGWDGRVKRLIYVVNVFGFPGRSNHYPVVTSWQRQPDFQIKKKKKSGTSWSPWCHVPTRSHIYHHA